MESAKDTAAVDPHLSARGTDARPRAHSSSSLSPSSLAVVGPAEKDDPARHLVDLAIEVSGWSPCRSKRGVVIFDRDENLVAHGHNYKPQGFDCDGSAACKSTCRREAIHAEQRALLAAGNNALGAEMLHVKTVDGRLVPSGGPSCVECSKLALAAGVKAMCLFHEHGWQRYEIAEFHRLSLAALALPPEPEKDSPPESPVVMEARTRECLRPKELGRCRESATPVWDWCDGCLLQALVAKT